MKTRNLLIISAVGIGAIYLLSAQPNIMGGGTAGGFFQSIREFGTSTKELFSDVSQLGGGIVDAGSKVVDMGGDVVNVGKGVIEGVTENLGTLGEGVKGFVGGVGKVAKVTAPISRSLLIGVSPIHAFMETKKAVPKVISQVKRIPSPYISAFKRVATLGLIT